METILPLILEGVRLNVEPGPWLPESEGDASRIFAPFVTTRLGRHGAIQVDGSPGNGSVFRVLLPVPSPAAGASPEPATGPSGGAAQRTVMIVDDEAMVRNVTRRTLERAGYRVLLAESGRQALNELATAHTQVGLVILDLTMPEMSGEETLALIREQWPELRVLLSSGYSADVGAHLAGLAGFIQKPYLPNELVEAVDRAYG